MDPWKELSVWKISRDEVRQWAALEGKSPTMSDDLYRCRQPRAQWRWETTEIISFGAHAVIWLIEAWRYIRRG